ncbi:MAG: hypothetical protein Q9218_004083 [Villophora microphyllina]
MADGSVHKQGFAVRDLATQTVTLYPSRAEIVRDVKDIILKSGLNEITICGLTPTIDERSIKVDGKGAATITNMTVDLIPNPDKYEDIYPSSDVEDEDKDQQDYDDSLEEPQLTEDTKGELVAIDDEIRRAREGMASAGSQLAMLEDYASTIRTNRPVNLKEFVASYREERSDASERKFACAKQSGDLETRRAHLLRDYDKSMRDFRTQKKVMEKEKAQVREKKHQASQEKLAAQRRLKEERAVFWPKKVYRVTISLDAASAMTSASSRRSSTTDISTAKEQETSVDSYQISLTLSYITDSAWWAPRYDLALNTVKNSGLLTYRAEYCNITSESWKDARLILSTSQSSFQGLGESIPTMLPWRVRLRKNQTNDGTSGALQSSRELLVKGTNRYHNNWKSTQSRNALFDGAESDEDMGFGSKDYGNSNRKDKTILPDLPSLSEADYSWSDCGFTTSYDIPNLRTVAPLSTKRLLSIASVRLSEIVFDYTIIPKRSAAAYLKARIFNASSLPRCSAGDSISLSLGIDIGISVTYADPLIKRSETGLWSKERYGVYTRTCTVTNTKPDRVIEGQIIDQLPVSEDERLRIEVLQPAGLSREGKTVAAGAAFAGKENEKWGNAKATSKKDGEVCWDMKIEPGKGAMFVLEYEARFPITDTVVGAIVHGSAQEGAEIDEDQGFGLFD